MIKITVEDLMLLLQVYQVGVCQRRRVECQRGRKCVCSVMCNEYSVSGNRYPLREIMARLYVLLWPILVKAQVVWCVGRRP